MCGYFCRVLAHAISDAFSGSPGPLGTLQPAFGRGAGLDYQSTYHARHIFCHLPVRPLVVTDPAHDGISRTLMGLISEEHTSELQSRGHLVLRLLPDKALKSLRIC